MSYQQNFNITKKSIKKLPILNNPIFLKIMPSLTPTTINMSTTSQQENPLLIKTQMNTSLSHSSLNTNIPYTNSNTSSPISPTRSIKLTHHRHRTNSHNHHYNNNHVRRLSTLDCYTLKNEIVKLNPKSSYCFDNNSYDYSKSTDWKENIQYHKGELVCYNRQYYEVIQDVLSEENQTPDIANDYYILIISRVSRVASKRVLISKWTPYCRYITKGEQVFYDGKVWTALVSQNYEEDKKKNPLFVADSPDQPSQKGLWEIEDYNIDELEIVEDMIEFSNEDNTSDISSVESEFEDADIESGSAITENENEDSFISDVTKDLNDMEITSASSSTFNSPSLLKNEFIKENENSANSDNTINEEDFNYIQNKKDLKDIMKKSEIQITLSNQSR